jgi:flagellar basal-body rod modification protein FlgD
MSNTINTADLSPVIAGVPARKVTSGNNSMGKDQFLQILITQLKNQDPLSPMQDKDFIAQMAQFSSVEQLTEMNGNLKSMLAMLSQSLGSASGIIGKTISWSVPGKGVNDLPTVGSGVVEAIAVKNKAQYAVVDGKDIPIDRISRIEN